MGPTSSTRSAQGTRLNKRGIESRRRFIDVAIETLATDGPAGASANLIAKRAGVTWGTVQHQFGDADGVWAAIVDHMIDQVADLEPPVVAGSASVRRSVTTLIDLLWKTAAQSGPRAVESLRLALPRDHDVFEADYPKTAESFRRLVAIWDSTSRRYFADLDVSKTRLRRVQALIPAAIRGLRLEADLLTYTDPADGLEALAAGVIAYLDPD